MNIDLRAGDSLQVLKEIKDNTIDSVVTDPPYGLSFMGKKWDYDVPTTELWKEVIRVLKPGGHLLSFSSSRTYHRMAVAVEDAGFEIRDQIMWVYGSGFPKSHNIGKSYDKKMGNDRKSLGENPNKAGRVNSGSGQFAGAVDDDWKPREVIGTKADFAKDGAKRKSDNHQSMQDTMNADIKVGYKEGWGTQVTKGFSKYEGWGTALKPSHEPIVLARKPFKGTVVDNVIKHGTGGINIDKSRVEPDEALKKHQEKYNEYGDADNPPDTTMFGTDGKTIGGDGNGGRFPANFIHDGSDEVMEHFPDTTSGYTSPHHAVGTTSWFLDESKADKCGKHLSGKGSAARFFYCAKVSKKERNAGLNTKIPDVPKLTKEEQMERYGLKTDNYVQLINLEQQIEAGVKKEDLNVFAEYGSWFEEKIPEGRDAGQDKLNGPHKQRPVAQANTHPTVKPVKLMTYLVNLITPIGGTVLDPFMGSGSTGMACKQEGFNFIGIDLDESYVEIAKARIDGWE